MPCMPAGVGLFSESLEVLAQMGLHLGMEITNWPPENIEDLAKRLEEPY